MNIVAAARKSGLPPKAFGDDEGIGRLTADRASIIWKPDPWLRARRLCGSRQRRPRQLMHHLSIMAAYWRALAARRPSTARSAERLLCLASVISIGLMPIPAAAFLHSATDSNSGRPLYVEHCAACHGVNLEGQPEWRSPDANGLYPAPPHDEAGHTWHHGDAMLIDYITRGGQAVLDDMGVPFTSGMPGFGSVLDESETGAILDYIKSTWPDHIRDLQAERSDAEAGN